MNADKNDYELIFKWIAAPSLALTDQIQSWVDSQMISIIVHILGEKIKQSLPLYLISRCKEFIEC